MDEAVFKKTLDKKDISPDTSQQLLDLFLISNSEGREFLLEKIKKL